MAKQVHIHIHRNKVRDAGEGEDKGRWITLSPSGTHVKVNGSGEITAGPKGLTGKKPSELSKGSKKEGEVGYEEQQKYGKYFSKGEMVTTGSGKHHEVISHVGPAVETTGGRFHPTKISRVEKAPKLGPLGEREQRRQAEAAKLAERFGIPVEQARKELEAEEWDTGEASRNLRAAQKQPSTQSKDPVKQAREWEEKASALQVKAQQEYTRNGKSDEYMRLRNEAQEAYNKGTDIMAQAVAQSKGKPGPDGKPMGIHPALAAVTKPGDPIPGSGQQPEQPKRAKPQRRTVAGGHTASSLMRFAAENESANANMSFSRERRADHDEARSLFERAAEFLNHADAEQSRGDQVKSDKFHKAAEEYFQYAKKAQEKAMQWSPNPIPLDSKRTDWKQR